MRQRRRAAESVGIDPQDDAQPIRELGRERRIDAALPFDATFDLSDRHDAEEQATLVEGSGATPPRSDCAAACAVPTERRCR
jgi:hypothetical protein